MAYQRGRYKSNLVFSRFSSRIGSRAHRCNPPCNPDGERLFDGPWCPWMAPDLRSHSHRRVAISILAHRRWFRICPVVPQLRLTELDRRCGPASGIWSPLKSFEVGAQREKKRGFSLEPLTSKTRNCSHCLWAMSKWSLLYEYQIFFFFFSF